MSEHELLEFLRTNYGRENEHCEWKEWKTLKNSISGMPDHDCISYVSAIANSGGGHLVIGVQDQLVSIVGIQDFDRNPKYIRYPEGFTIENIKPRIVGNCPNLDTENFHAEEFECADSGKIVWILHIPKHKFRLPVYAHRKAYQRLGDSIDIMTEERRQAIINEPAIVPDDWSAVTLPSATMDDLDRAAIAKARSRFDERNNHEQQWDERKFLEKMGLIINGQITRAAFLLFGNEHSQHLIGHNLKIRWILRSAIGDNKDHEIFPVPFFLVVDKIFAKIRNLTYRYLPEGTLLTEQLLQYDPFVIRESLHNAIAHQDYAKHTMINVTEVEDERLVFYNAGTFLPESVREVIRRDVPQSHYRNPLLANAMRQLAMVEQQGGGIRKMCLLQRQRRFPMPEYDMGKGDVTLTVTGKILDENFTKILNGNPNLSIDEILLLDMVQKGKQINGEAAKHLRKKGLVQGRVTSLYLSHKVVSNIEDETLRNKYIENTFDNQYFMELIVRLLKELGPANRKTIDGILMPKLPERMSHEQKKERIAYLIKTLRKNGMITLSEGKNWEFLR